MFRLLQSTSSWTDPVRLNAAVTVLLMADLDPDTGFEARNLMFRGLRTGRYSVDTKLLVDLYAACSRELRKRLVSSSVFGYLEPRAFEQRFLETYRSKALTVLERRDLTGSLGTYLWRHPTRLNRFAPLILELLRSSQWEWRLRGLAMARALSTMTEADRRLVRRALLDRSPEIKMNSFNLLFWWMKRKTELSPDLRAFCLSPEIREIAFDRYQRDPDVDVQTCAYYFLKAREPRAGHKPPKGMPVPPPRRKRRRRASP